MVHVYTLYMHHSFRLHTICNTLLVQRCVNVECTAQFLNQQCWKRNIYIYIRDYVKKCATTHTCIKSPTTSLGNDFFAVTLNMPTSMVIYMWQS